MEVSQNSTMTLNSKPNMKKSLTANFIETLQYDSDYVIILMLYDDINPSLIAD